LEIANKFDAEIINADSRQVYRYMDIGTDKPTVAQMAAVPHHLFNIINPDEDFGLAQFQELARRTIRDIHERDKLPLLVGGSGQYVWALLEGWKVPRIPPDREFRKASEDSAAKNGIEGLYRRLQDIDPESAKKIDKRNIRRVIRALEVALHSDKPFSALQKKDAPDYTTLIIGLTAERKDLYRRIDLRVESMIQRGLVNETENLIKMGYDYSLPAINSIGYKHIGMVLRGEISLDEAIERIKTHNHKFVRHQYTWFRLEDKRIHWFDVKNDIDYEVMTLLSNSLTQLEPL
jgi:tRNA dimethylallyltransferase